MLDYGAAPPIYDSIKQLAMNAYKASQPADLKFGVVISTSPLQIQLNQKMILTDEYLILTNAVKDHAVDITISWTTIADNYLDAKAMMHTHQAGNYKDGEGSSVTGISGIPVSFDTTHHHDIQGRKKIIIHNGLTVGEEVLLLRVPGGQHYVVLDRVDEIVTTGESI